jgi:hypothetical protein
MPHLSDAIYSIAKIILNVRRQIVKENQRVRFLKKYYRTVASCRYSGFSRKQRRIYINKKRISVSKRAVYLSISREPIT